MSFKTGFRETTLFNICILKKFNIDYIIRQICCLIVAINFNLIYFQRGRESQSFILGENLTDFFKCVTITFAI